MKSVEEKNEEFVLTILHDIKSPISSINIALQNIKFEDEILKEVYKVNKHNLDYIENLIGNYSFKTGTYTPSKENFNLITLINEEIFALRFAILDKNLKLNLTYGTASIPLVTDKNLLRRVILNLITNSIKHSPFKSEIKIEIKKFKEKIFITFENSTIKAQTGSTGLGRGIIKNSIEKLGGKISGLINNQRAVFSIELPIETN